MPKIQEIRARNLTWFNITKPGKKEIKWLEENFEFHPLDLKDCLPPLQRPKLVAHPHYLFMILQFPVYDKKTKKIVPSELDFFITSNSLVTVNDNQLKPLNDFFGECQKDGNIKDKYLNGSLSTLLYEILNRLLFYCFPILNHISLDIDKIEEKIFIVYKKETVHEILLIERNIVNFRKIMQAHKNVIKKLIEESVRFFSSVRLKIYFTNLVEYTKDIWDFLENYKDTINALHKTHESLISFRLNDIMKTLTVFAVIVFPLTLLAAIFGMNAINMPLVNKPHGFWVIIGIMIIGTIIMFSFFKKKKWV